MYGIEIATSRSFTQSRCRLVQGRPPWPPKHKTQISPLGIVKLFKAPKSKPAERAFAAMLNMEKIDIAALEKARKG